MDILILSDLHIGPGVRCESMLPTNDIGRPSMTSVPSKEDLRRSLTESILANHPKLDYLVLPGDVADRGQVEQYDHFDVFAAEILAATGISPSAVFYTPGNHDVDWQAMPSGTTKLSNPSRWDMRFQPMSRAATLSSAANLYSVPYWNAWNDGKIVVVSVNTAAGDYAGEPNHPGTIAKETLAEIDTYFLSNRIPADNPKILLIHHHPLPYPNVFPNWSDFSIVQSQSDLFGFCGRHRIDFIVHGHRHQPHFNRHICKNGHEVFIVSAGSVSQKFPSYVYGTISNQYHVLSLHGRDSVRHTLKGELQSYAFSQVAKWRPSAADTDGIAAIVPFGPHIDPKVVVKDLMPVVKSITDQNKVCKYDHLKAAKKYVRYLTPEVLTNAIDSICAELGLSTVGTDVPSLVIFRS